MTTFNMVLRSNNFNILKQFSNLSSLSIPAWIVPSCPTKWGDTSHRNTRRVTFQSIQCCKMHTSLQHECKWCEAAWSLPNHPSRWDEKYSIWMHLVCIWCLYVMFIWCLLSFTAWLGPKLHCANCANRVLMTAQIHKGPVHHNGHCRCAKEMGGEDQSLSAKSNQATTATLLFIHVYSKKALRRTPVAVSCHCDMGGPLYTPRPDPPRLFIKLTHRTST